MTIDDELHPEPRRCSLCLGDGVIDGDYFAGKPSGTQPCPECDGEGWVLP